MKKALLFNRSLSFETLEARLPLAATAAEIDPGATDESQLSAVVQFVESTSVGGTNSDHDLAGAGSNDETSAWAETRGIYVFNLAAYQGDWAPRDWTLSQWETWLDTMQFLNLNHLQLPRAPWSERPGLTQFELDKEALWISVLQSAKARGMTTSLIFGTTWHGDLAQPWRILSPGNSPADPNWQILVSDYQYWANRYGLWVDEWLMGVEDPGGSPSSAGITDWAYETPSPLGNPSRVSELVALELAMRSSAQSVNPASRVVAETWGLQWWGLTPGFSSHLNEFLSYVPSLPADVTLSTNAQTNSVTDALQATGRDVDAWPFFLIDHEYPVGHTKLHFNYTQNYLRTIKNQGIDDVVTHISHPMEQLPSLYVYSRLLEDTELNKLTLLQEFSSFLVADPPDQSALANAISELGLFYESVSVINNWNPSTLQPVNANAPYTPRYNATQLGYLNNALANISLVDSPRAVSQIPMLVTAAEWVEMIRDQIQFLHDAAFFGSLVTDSANYLNGNYPSIAAIDEPLSLIDAQEIVNAYLSIGSARALADMDDYLSQFWVSTAGQNHPLGIIYDYLRDNIPTSASGLAAISGNYLEYDAPGFPAVLKQLEGRIEQTDESFSYLRSNFWIEDVNSAYSGGSAMLTSSTTNDVTIIFAGSGISLIHSLWNQGASATWTIDGGAGGTGTINMFSTTRQDQVETQLASGLEPTLHILRIRKTGGAALNSIMVDGINVQTPMSVPGNYNGDGVVDQLDYAAWRSSFGMTVTPFSGADGNGDGSVNAADYTVWRDNVGASAVVSAGNRLRRESNREAFSFSGSWTETTEGSPSGGAWNYTLEDGASVSIPFDGTAVGISVTMQAGYGVLAWSIDGGSGGSGTINLNSSNLTYRKQFILTTSLSEEPHTLVLSKQSGFLVNIDSIDTVVPKHTIPEVAVVRFEAESTGAIKDQGDAVGYDSISGVVGRAADAGASNGEFLFTSGDNRNFKIVFVGTGIDLIAERGPTGSEFFWILDEGAQSGTGSLLGDPAHQVVFPLVSGLPNTLHTLELRRNGGSLGTVLRVDAFDVHDAGTQIRYEQNDPAISYSAGNWLSKTWTLDNAAAEASGRSMAVSIVKNSTATINFFGTAVSLLADVRGDGGIFSFNIDNGSVIGTIDLRAQNPLLLGDWHRWPILLTNSLPAGNHTLVLTALEANSGGRGAVNFDAIDTYYSLTGGSSLAEITKSVEAQGGAASIGADVEYASQLNQETVAVDQASDKRVNQVAKVSIGNSLSNWNVFRSSARPLHAHNKYLSQRTYSHVSQLTARKNFERLNDNLLDGLWTDKVHVAEVVDSTMAGDRFWLSLEESPNSALVDDFSIYAEAHSTTCSPSMMLSRDDI